ncbi:MAG: sulfite exporter TauE/SafE family protein [Byssovorax sp.]
MDIPQAALLAAAAVVAGAINSVAGGGSLVSFPAALAVGMSPLMANATNAVALMPGSVASAYGYRREIKGDRAVIRLLLPAAALGGAIGSVLLLVTPQSLFDNLVPFLVLFATLLLLVQNLRRPAAAGAVETADETWNLPKSPTVTVIFQLLVGVYGGYFGAGIGIMMLALFAHFGARNIHRMNGVKTVLAAAINAVAAVAFVVARAIDYRAAAIMAAGAIFGGLLGAAGARRVKPAIVRWGVVTIGLVLFAQLAYKRWS